MDLHMLSLGTLRAFILLYLVPKGPLCLFYITKHQAE